LSLLTKNKGLSFLFLVDMMMLVFRVGVPTITFWN